MRFLDKLLLTDVLECRIVDWDPRDRRRTAIRALTFCSYLMIVNVGLYIFGIINQEGLILITLILSWLALNFTFIDIVATTDVREETM
jgi:hypothetical protein